jgi:carboxyl-terminal processing protease
VPDSLKTAFQTRNGRVVYDGGGVSPDVAVDRHEYAQITRSLIDNHLLFHYATEYVMDKDSLQSPKDFRLNDREYENFKSWLGSRTFNYQTALEAQLADLKLAVKEDPNQAFLQKSIDELGKAIERAKAKDLDTYKTEILRLLEQEIASRFYLERGMIESTFDKDPDILKAIEVVSDDRQYGAILKN